MNTGPSLEEFQPGLKAAPIIVTDQLFIAQYTKMHTLFIYLHTLVPSPCTTRRNTKMLVRWVGLPGSFSFQYTTNPRIKMLLTSPLQPTGSSFDGNDTSLRYNLTFDLPEEKKHFMIPGTHVHITSMKQTWSHTIRASRRTWIHQQNNNHEQEIIFCNDLKSCNHSMLGISK